MLKNKYSKREIVGSLKKVGIKSGDQLFTHANVGFFGVLAGAKNSSDYYNFFKEAIFEVIGPAGTWVMPTFSYSFFRKQDFNPAVTPGVCGFLSEEFRLDPHAIRSQDANFSVAAVGKYAQYFTGNAPGHSFGADSFWERFLKKNGKFCSFNLDSGSTFIHYVEKKLQVPYRYDKAFTGKLILKGKSRRGIFYHFVYDLSKPNNGPDFTKFDKKAKKLGLTRTVNLGKGQILSIAAKNVFDLISEELKNNPAFLISGKKIQL
jgi:aminoglycoside 3-N-acetyltransferase